MKQVLASVVAGAVLAAAAPAPARQPATAPPLYRCAGADGKLLFSRLPIDGASCTVDKNTAPPGWTRVAGSEGIAVFTHSALGKPPPGLVKVWVLYSFDAPKGAPGQAHHSAKSLEFHSCEHGTFAVGTTIKYSRPFGEGEVVESTRSESLRQMEIPPDTASAWVWKSVCAP